MPTRENFRAAKAQATSDSGAIGFASPIGLQRIGLRTALLVAGCLAALGLLYGFKLGAFPLLDPDESIYGDVAREMMHGDWLSPHLGGALWFDKPPLFYWLSSASARVFGLNEFACRLPSALLAAGLVGLVYALALPDFGRRAARICALVMATCLLQIALAHAALTDMTLAFFLTLALLCYRRWLGCAKSATRHQLLWAIGCGAATGLAMLDKGPVAPLLLSLTFFLHLWWTRKLARLRHITAAVALLSALVVGLPWFVAMYVLHGHEFVQGFLVANNITRLMKAEHTHAGKWYAAIFNVPALFAFFFPWSVFLPQALARAWKQSRENENIRNENAAQSIDGTKLALAWFGVVFVFFSISRTQLVTYTFPLYPAAALLVGVLWSGATSSEATSSGATSSEATSSERTDATAIARGLRWGLGFDMALALALAVFALSPSVASGREARTPVVIAAIILLLAFAFAWRALPRSESKPSEGEQSVTTKKRNGAWALGGGMACAMFWLASSLPPRLMEERSTRDILRRLPLQSASLVVLDVHAPSLLFYSGLRPRLHLEPTKDKREAELAWDGAAPVFLLCPRREVKKLALPGAAQWIKTGKLIVLANARAAALPKP